MRDREKELYDFDVLKTKKHKMWELNQHSKSHFVLVAVFLWFTYECLWMFMSIIRKCLTKFLIKCKMWKLEEGLLSRTLVFQNSCIHMQAYVYIFNLTSLMPKWLLRIMVLTLELGPGEVCFGFWAIGLWHRSRGISYRIHINHVYISSRIMYNYESFPV